MLTLTERPCSECEERPARPDSGLCLSCEVEETFAPLHRRGLDNRPLTAEEEQYAAALVRAGR